MARQFWSIDSALQIHPVTSIPASALPVDQPEQSIDTLLLRNLATLCSALVGMQAKFLFHSTEYWGPFDIGCILSDGSIVAIENKSTSVDRVGFGKFCDDIRRINNEPEEFIRHRFNHVLANLPNYIVTAERMYSAFFLGIRCDNKPRSRDLSVEACQLRSISRERFLLDFRQGNSWLENLRDCSSLEAYIDGFTTEPALSKVIPFLLVPNTCENRVRTWLPERGKVNGAKALLGCYQFYSESNSFPQWLSIDSPQEIEVSKPTTIHD